MSKTKKLGIFGSVCFSGYKLDIMKSGLQKYCRRRELDKMIRCLVEIDSFSKHGNASKGIRTNLINRLKVICVEELCFCDIGKFLRIIRNIKSWEEGGRKDRKLLVEICYVLCGSELLRLCSDIKSYFWNNSLEYKFKNSPNLSLKYKKATDDSKVIRYLEEFIVNLNNNNDDLFYWAFRIMSKANKGIKGAIRWRRKDCDYIIWEVLFDKCGNDVKLKECLEFDLKEYFRKNRFLKGDRINYIIHAILLIKNRKELNWDDGQKYEFDIDKLYELNEKFEVDDYVIDKHCSKGRKLGKGLIEFMKEGSLVVNENKKWFVEKYRKKYIQVKINKTTTLEDKLEVIDFNKFKNLKKCLIKTCGNKAMCWYAKYDGLDIVLKEGRASINYNRDYMVLDELKELFGLKRIGMRRVKINKVSQKNGDDYEWVSREGVVYCLMDRINGVELIKKKGKIKKVLRELVKIGIFRGIFRVSDYNLKNVFIDNEDNLYSIDENNIGGRKKIFNKNFRFKKYITKELIEDIIKDLGENKPDKKSAIINKMLEYGFKRDLIGAVLVNYNNLRKNVYEELEM